MPNCLTPRFRYEKMADMAGGKGYFCETTEEIQSAVKAALEVIFFLHYLKYMQFTQYC